MSTMSKSIKRVTKEALVIGESSLSAYSKSKSPHKFRQSQLFACLVLKEHLRMNYRSVHSFLSEFGEVRKMLGLKVVPHFTTLQKAGARLLKKGAVRSLLEETLFLYSIKKAG